MPDSSASTFDRLETAARPFRELAHGRTSASRLIGRAIVRNPLRSLAWLGVGGVGFAVFANLLLLQPEQHRSPMFVGTPQIHGTPVPADVPLPPTRALSAERDAEEARRAELLRDIQVELKRRGHLQGEADGAPGPRTTKAIRDVQAQLGLPVNGEASESLLAALLTSPVSTGAVPQSAARPRDQIANLLKANPDRFERPPTVAAVQRALTRLGYGPLKDDGQFGPGTRAALDKFERDRKLPSRSENPNRVLRELSQASGIAID